MAVCFLAGSMRKVNAGQKKFSDFLFLLQSGTGRGKPAPSLFRTLLMAKNACGKIDSPEMIQEPADTGGAPIRMLCGRQNATVAKVFRVIPPKIRDGERVSRIMGSFILLFLPDSMQFAFHIPEHG